MAIKRRASRVYSKAVERDRPYTYISKRDNKTKNHRNNMRTKHMESGNKNLRFKDAAVVFSVKTTDSSHIPEKVYEVVRLSFLTLLNQTFTKIEKKDYLYRYIKIPHQILRLKTAASAGKGISVDRISTGMKNAFGKFYSFATRICKKTKEKKVIPQQLIKVYFTNNYANAVDIKKIQEILKTIGKKLPVTVTVRYHLLEEPKTAPPQTT